MNKKILYQSDILERFIPVSLDRLITDLTCSNLLDSSQIDEFKKLCHIYTALYHSQTHTQLQTLKAIYQPFNPDRDVLVGQNDQSANQLQHFKQALRDMLEKANFEPLSENDLNEALNKISPHGVKVSVDFDEFADVTLYYRGTAIQTENRRNLKSLQFKKQSLELQIYRRLFVVLQPKNRQQRIEELIKDKKISQKKAEKKVDTAFKSLGISGDRDIVYLKLFKDIPTADLEMLFPNTRVQMRMFDKVKLGIMGGSGTAGGVMATISKFSAAIDPMSAVLAIGGLLGVLWRQIQKFFSQKAKYSAILTKNLYFYCLDNNLGAMTTLVDSAESEECKEAILSYFFLLVKGSVSRSELDQKIESFILQQYDIPMDFEIEDGLQKLEKAGLLSTHNQLLNVLSLPEAIDQLTQTWIKLINNTSSND